MPRRACVESPPTTRRHVCEHLGHGLTVYRILPARLSSSGRLSSEPFCPAPPMPLDRWQHTIERLEAGWTRHVWRWTPPADEEAGT